MYIPLRLEVPIEIWLNEELFRQYLEDREINDFFWEVMVHDGYVTIEVIDGGANFTEQFTDDSIISEDKRGGIWPKIIIDHF